MQHLDPFPTFLEEEPNRSFTRGSFLYVGQAIAANLSSAERKLMTDFFARELRTPNFVRAMSQDDPSANVTGSRRSDHNQVTPKCNCS